VLTVQGRPAVVAHRRAAGQFRSHVLQNAAVGAVCGGSHDTPRGWSAYYGGWFLRCLYTI